MKPNISILLESNQTYQNQFYTFRFNSCCSKCETKYKLNDGRVFDFEYILLYLVLHFFNRIVLKNKQHNDI
jgi:hypothetical protein